MSQASGRMSLQGGLSQYGPIAPTCFIQSTITGECASRPITHEPLLRGLVPSANTSFILPGSPCGLSSFNAHIPCGGGSYCSDVQLGVCTFGDANFQPNVNLAYINYGSRL